MSVFAPKVEMAEDMKLNNVNMIDKGSLGPAQFLNKSLILPHNCFKGIYIYNI